MDIMPSGGAERSVTVVNSVDEMPETASALDALRAYAIGFPDGLVKVGISGDVRRRAKELAAQ